MRVLIVSNLQGQLDEGVWADLLHAKVKNYTETREKIYTKIQIQINRNLIYMYEVAQLSVISVMRQFQQL